MTPSNLFKPMLAAKIKPVAGVPVAAAIKALMQSLDYPVFASPKLDGIRCTVQHEALFTRSLKPVPNAMMRKAWSGLKEGFDGEIICGPPAADNVFSCTTSQVRSVDGGMLGACYWVFDKYHPTETFSQRFAAVGQIVSKLRSDCVRAVPHKLIKSYAELERFESKMLEQGFEGICTRSPEGRYKQGRSTLTEGGLIAFKRFVDAEAKILSVFEQMENTNAQKVNELGRSKRSSHKAGMVGKNMLGGFVVQMLKPADPDVPYFSEQFNIGTGVGLTDEVRQELWQNRKRMPGQIVKFKFQLIGTMEKPREPIFMGFRDEVDL